MHDLDEHSDAATDEGSGEGLDDAAETANSGDSTPLLDELLDDAQTPREPAAGLGPRTRVGSFVEWTSGHAPKVEFPGNERGPLAARSIIPLDPTTIAEAIASGRGVLLTFEDGRPDAPIVTGLLQDVFGTEPQVWETSEADEQPGEAEQSTNLADVDARVDGKRIELEAADEIVLRRNGRVVIRGTYVETRSRGVNRIKGGSVQIN